MEKIKIIIDIERMKYPFTGLYNYCENLYKNLLKSNNKEFDFYFFSILSVNLPKNINRISCNFKDKLWLIKPKKYKLWHITYQNSRFVPKGKIKVVYTIHDLNFLYTNKSELKKKKLLKRVQKIINRADYITVISNFVLDDIKKNLDLGNKPVSVVYNGVTLNEFPDFDKPKYRPTKKYIFTLGTVLYKKHFHILPQLVAETNYELVIAGIHPDADYIKQIEAEIKKNNVQAQVTLTGPISDEEKYWYMKNCSAFVFPSISEGFGIPPIEAMLMGKPVFLSTHTSLPEIGGKQAYYFNSFKKNEMKKIFVDGMKDYTENNKESAIIEWAQQFNWEKASKEYLKVYRQTLGIKPVVFQEQILPITKELNKNILKLTALVITYNEEDNMEALLKNISFADEIIIIDSFSKDKTVEIINKRTNVKLIQNKFENFSKQRNFALEQATNDWVLFIDADERVSDKLKNEIIAILNNPTDIIAYRVHRKNYISNKLIKYSGWQNDTIYRFFNKKYVNYDEKIWVHETLLINGKTKLLTNFLIHYTFKNYIDYRNKIILYSELKANELFEKKIKPNFFHFYIKPSYRYVYHYIIRLGFLDNKRGRIIASLSAFGVKNRYKELKNLYK